MRVPRKGFLLVQDGRYLGDHCANEKRQERIAGSEIWLPPAFLKRSAAAPGFWALASQAQPNVGIAFFDLTRSGQPLTDDENVENASS